VVAASAAMIANNAIGGGLGNDGGNDQPTKKS